VRLLNFLRNNAVDVLWLLRPRGSATRYDDATSLVRRFPYWTNGRKRLAEEALAHENVALAYAEALALRTLSPSESPLYAESSLLLGICFLRKGDAETARHYLLEAEQRLPDNWRIKEELAATFTLSGNKDEALKALQKIPQQQLSQEGRAVLQWLTTSETRNN
jgi:tetratricopeptide (TPR) repeat protein